MIFNSFNKYLSYTYYVSVKDNNMNKTGMQMRKSETSKKPT